MNNEGDSLGIKSYKLQNPTDLLTLQKKGEEIKKKNQASKCELACNLKSLTASE